MGLNQSYASHFNTTTASSKQSKASRLSLKTKQKISNTLESQIGSSCHIAPDQTLSNSFKSDQNHTKSASINPIIRNINLSRPQTKQAKTIHYEANATNANKCKIGEPSSQTKVATIDLEQKQLQQTLHDKRRDSIKNGDVFIYPQFYRDLNECQKCSRDNKICDCNNSDLTSLVTKSNSLQTIQSSLSLSSSTNCNGNSNFYFINDTNESNLKSVEASKEAPKCLPICTDRQYKSALEIDSQSISQQENNFQLFKNKQAEQMALSKSAYKISIATASIDQKSNQIRMSTPKIFPPRASTTTSLNQCDSSSIVSSLSLSKNCLNNSLVYDDRMLQKDHISLNSEEKKKQVVNIKSFQDYHSIESPVTALSIKGPSLKLEDGFGEVDENCEKIKCSNRNPKSGISMILVDKMSEKSQLTKVDSNKSYESLDISQSKENHDDRFFPAEREQTSHYPLLKQSRQTGKTIAKLEAKVTAISIGSPAKNFKQISDLEKVISPLLTTATKDKCIDFNNNNDITDIDETNLSRVIQTEIDSPHESTTFTEEQLTCKLDVGDSIEIMSTSICLNEDKCITIPTKCGQDISLGQINETTTSELSDYTSIVPIQTIPSSSKRKNMISRLSRQAIYEQFDEDDTNSEASVVKIAENKKNESGDQESVSSVLEYSPILTGVRDFIENVNSEARLNSTLSDSMPLDAEVGLISDTLCGTTFANKQLVPMVDAAPMQNYDTSISIVGTKSISQSSANQVTTTTTSHKLDIETPKKSIFDGASKDEILEYLQDARERVPEVLIAADDVMVISENELIVVNQLEPGSPATPISILEDNEEICATRIANHELESESYPRCTGNSLRRLQSIYDSSRFNSNNNTLDDDTGIQSDNHSVTNSKFDSTNDSFDVHNSVSYDSTQMSSNDSSRIRGETLDSLDDQVSCIDPLGSSSSHMKSSNEIQIGNDKDGKQVISDHSSNKNFRRSVKKTSSSVSFSNDTNNDLVTQNSHHMTNTINFTGFLQSSLFATRLRRNSTSATCSKTDRKKIRMRLLNGRDSLSSSSSSPSSASPSSTNSSEQTSDNCSTTSNFYASSSLSCSSPFLALTGSCSPAFNTSSSNCEPNMRYDFGQNVQRPILECKDHNNYTDGYNLSSQNDKEDSGVGSETSASCSGKSLVFKNKVAVQSDEIVANSPEQLKDIYEVNDCFKIHEREPHKDSKRYDSTSVQKKQATSSIDNKAFINTKTSQQINLVPRTTSHSHHVTFNRLNNYLTNRKPNKDNVESKMEFQCLDCDQFIDVDQTTMLNKTNEFCMLRDNKNSSLVDIICDSRNLLSSDRLDRAYIAAINGLPLCKPCEKKRIERKEIISEFVETEIKYGRDLKIIHDEFYRPMQIAGLLSKDQINGIFLNLEELIMANCRFAERLEASISEALSIGDSDYSSVNIGKLFVESAEMLHTFESYCVRQGLAACLLARLAKEKELLRIFLRVSQMENTLLRRMNLAAFLMVPVQRVTKYPLLLNRLYKVTAYHHKDREALREAQLKVELHLEHINQQTKGIGATNKIWRRISNLSAPISNRRGLINAEDIGYIKLRKTAMDMLKWDRDETQFIHSGKVTYAPLNEYLTKQKAKPLRYMAAHALLIVLGKPNWRYRPDLVKSSLDSKLLTPTLGGTGIKEAALLLFREKNNRFVLCREPLYLSNCVLSNDCSHFNSECSLNQPNCINQVKCNSAQQQYCTNIVNSSGMRRSVPGLNDQNQDLGSPESRAASAEMNACQQNNQHQSIFDVGHTKSLAGLISLDNPEQRMNVGTISMSSFKSLQEEPTNLANSVPIQTPRSFSLASALPRGPISTTNSINHLSKSNGSNLTIINQLMTKVNSYHKQSTNNYKLPLIVNNYPNQSANDSGLSMNQNSTPPNANIEGGQRISASQLNCNNNVVRAATQSDSQHQHYKHLNFHNHHQLYGDYEESFEIHERLSKESILLRADTPLKTRYWLQMLRYHAKDLGQWRLRRNAFSNIIMMRQE